jgi:hypothetical protein
MTPLWDFTDLIPADRRRRLLKLTSFDEVLCNVSSTCKILHYKADPFRDDRLRGCVRAEFLLHVDLYIYDGFFNSPVGYRAQYCLGSGIGEHANRQIIDVLRPALITLAQSMTTPTFGSEHVAMSLDATDAKIWIDESESGSEPPQQLQVHINYPPWVERAKRGDALQEDEFIRAVRGVFAPLGTFLEIKGGWVDGDGLEKRDPVKAHRSKDIAINGYI